MSHPRQPVVEHDWVSALVLEQQEEESHDVCLELLDGRLDSGARALHVLLKDGVGDGLLVSVGVHDLDRGLRLAGVPAW